MVKIIWSEPALSDLDAIADFIAIENPDAAAKLVRRVFEHVGQLKMHPKSGSIPKELRRGRYRQIIEPPCRIFYRHDEKVVEIVHVLREEQLLRRGSLTRK